MIHTALAIIWCLIKLAVIAVVAISLIFAIIAVLHPIVLDGKVRTTQNGQKIYLKLSYLFNILGIEFEASPNANRTYFRYFWMRKLIDKKDRIKEKAEEKNQVVEQNTEAQTEQFAESVPETVVEAKNEVPAEAKTEIKTETEVTAEAKIESEEKAELNEPQTEQNAQEVQEVQEEKKEPEAKQETIPTDEHLQTKAEYSEKEQKNTIKPESERAQIELPKEIPVKEEGFFEKIRRLLKKFKRDANRRLDELKGKLRLARKHWRICKPAAKRLWRRIKKFVEIKNGNLLVRYALPKPHLTGMLYGAAAGFFDLFRRLGIEFSLIPVFTGASQTFYLRFGGRVVLRPFWILWGLFCLLFEFSLYKEYYALYKFIKSRKGKKENK